MAEDVAAAADYTMAAQAAGGETAAAEKAAQTDACPFVNLPAIAAPDLGAAEQQAEDKGAEQSAEANATLTSAARSRRFMMLAASVAFAAGFGSFVGSVSGTGLARFIYPPPAPASAAENTMAAMREIKLELTEIAALKASLDNAARSATSQYVKITDRLDHLEQRSVAAADATGSLPPAAPAADLPKLNDRVLQDWIVHDVQNGRALVESRYGGLFDVGAGSVLPGIGRVDSVKRQDGHWVVLTARGTITSAR
jgi:hypothetical protein